MFAGDQPNTGKNTNKTKAQMERDRRYEERKKARLKKLYGDNKKSVYDNLKIQRPDPKLKVLKDKNKKDKIYEINDDEETR